ncbi:hypothetical protein [Citricoccus sp. GCM10030269]|uniref:hypothetical protein n=1 Tax=Citricoccus sp. GCM10030269 TaxID=3273388 RepID=UPI00360CB876
MGTFVGFIVFIGFILGIAVGAVVTWLISRRRSSRPDLARAWQEGYDAGSVASSAPVTSTAPVPTSTPEPPRPEHSPSATSPFASPYSPPAPAPAPVPAPPPPAAPSSAPPAPSIPPASPAASPPPPAPAPTRPAPTPEELAAAKERRDRRNVNITLYTACLLLVAAASLFIGASLPVTARVTGLAAVVGLFYGGGLVVHAVSATLRPAATAFTGTGLALVPVAGIALDALVVHNPVLSWLITSILGTAMMIVAAVRLDSTVVAYLTVPFLLSTVMASGAAIQQGMVWALIFSILLAILMAWLTVDGSPRNGWLTPAYRTAIARTHQWIVPGMVLSALVLGVWLEPLQMFMVLLAACAYYATVAVIGPRRHRLATTYAVRGGLLLALVPWGAMLEWSVVLTLTTMVVYLCLQIPLVWWQEVRWRETSEARLDTGYLPRGSGAIADHGVSWFLALGLTAMAQADLAVPADPVELAPGIGVAALVLALTTSIASVTFVHSDRLSRLGAPATANLVWQFTTPVALLPVLMRGEWSLELVLVATIVVQAVILIVLRRAGRARRLDTRIAPHLMAVAAVTLVYVVGERYLAGPELLWPAVLAALAALVWATVTALRVRALTRDAVLPVTVWALASLVATALLWSPAANEWPVSAAGYLAWYLAWYLLMLITAAVSLRWLASGTTSTSSPPPHEHPLELRVTVLIMACVVLAVAVLQWWSQAPWHLVAALVVLTGWLLAAAVVTRDRLPLSVRAIVLIAAQASSAVLVSTLVDRFGGDGSAARAGAGVALVAGLALRTRLSGRLQGLGTGLTTWLVTAVVATLWIIELGVGGDRAALMVIAAALIAAGVVLTGARGGHWAVLLGALALIVPAAPVSGLGGGWLPEPLIPTSAAAALLLLLALAVAGREIIAARAAAVSPVTNQASAWRKDPAVFRPVAAIVLWLVAAGMAAGMAAGATAGVGLGVLGVAMATAALLCYVFARTRRLLAPRGGTVVLTPVAVWWLSRWWQDRGGWFPDDVWLAVFIGVVSALVLGLWAACDAWSDSGAGSRQGPAMLWQGGLAVLLICTVFTVLTIDLRRGMPGDAAVWTACAAIVVGAWLLVDAWGRTPLWAGMRKYTAQDGAVLVSFAAASRAWWQTAEVDHGGRGLWWNVQALVLVLVGLGFWTVLRRQRSGSLTTPLIYFIAAAAVFSGAAVYVLAAGTAAMQLTVLIGFALVVVLGLTRREQILTWWGAAGVALSVLWYLREYTYVYLALLGVVLIVLAVRQLRRHQNQQANQQASQQPDR